MYMYFVHYHFFSISIVGEKVFNKLDRSILKEAYSSILALLLEAAKYDAEIASVR